jgi:hypothetical protein
MSVGAGMRYAGTRRKRVTVSQTARTAMRNATVGMS